MIYIRFLPLLLALFTGLRLFGSDGPCRFTHIDFSGSQEFKSATGSNISAKILYSKTAERNRIHLSEIKIVISDSSVVIDFIQSIQPGKPRTFVAENFRPPELKLLRT